MGNTRRPQGAAGWVYAVIELITGDHPPEETLLSDLRPGDGSPIHGWSISDDLEGDLNIGFSDEDIEQTKTIGDLIALVRRKRPDLDQEIAEIAEPPVADPDLTLRNYAYRSGVLASHLRTLIKMARWHPMCESQRTAVHGATQTLAEIATIDRERLERLDARAEPA
jgi:hypothetical protein